MADDIVTRLREHNCQNIYCCEVPDEAADEIERLRKDRDHWRSIAEQAVDNADQAVKLLEKLTGINRD